MVLVLLDGLGDRGLPELEGQTPAEAARTPRLDALATRGASGLHVPLGPGRAPSSEVAHWSLFGYQHVPFCGRAVLEALGHDQTAPEGAVLVHTTLRSSVVRGGRVWLTGRVGNADEADAEELLDAVAIHEADRLGFQLRYLRRGQAIVSIDGPATAEITDSDPFFDGRYPWLRPQAWVDARDPTSAARTAAALSEYLLRARRMLRAHSVNRRRAGEGRPMLDTLTTKWAGVRVGLPSFLQRVGVRGGIVSSSALYRGFAALLGMETIEVDAEEDPGADLASRLAAAATLLERGVAFVHVHTKMVDEAGHMKDPYAKCRVLEALDPALAMLDSSPFVGAVVAVTGDHATPSRDPVLHTGDPSPIVVAGSTVRPDSVRHFGEVSAAEGALGTLRAAEILPLLLSHANRPRFLGSRPSAYDTLALPDAVVEMPAD